MTFIINLQRLVAADIGCREMSLQAGVRWDLFGDDDTFAEYCELLCAQYTDQDSSDCDDVFEIGQEEDDDDGGCSFEQSSFLVKDFIKQERINAQIY
jgi:hypothetical protein